MHQPPAVVSSALVPVGGRIPEREVSPTQTIIIVIIIPLSLPHAIGVLYMEHSVPYPWWVRHQQLLSENCRRKNQCEPPMWSSERVIRWSQNRVSTLLLFIWIELQQTDMCRQSCWMIFRPVAFGHIIGKKILCRENRQMYTISPQIRAVGSMEVCRGSRLELETRTHVWKEQQSSNLQKSNCVVHRGNCVASQNWTVMPV